MIRWTRPMTRQDLVGLAGTYSSVITLPDGERTAHLAAVDRMAADAVGGPDAGPDATVELPLRCRCWRATRH